VLSVEEARRRVLDAVRVLEPIDLPVADAAGFALVEDQVAPHALPRFDNSAMDGYAVRAADTSGAAESSPVELSVIGEVQAGRPPGHEVEPGTSVRIMTGAAVPRGADGIVPVEHTSESDGVVSVNEPTSPGRHVRPAGDDIEAGAVAVRKGTELGPGELALLASLGLSPIAVVRRPRVAILVTGDELVDPEADVAPGRIRDSNTVALRALVTEAGAEIAGSERVPDDRGATLDAFKGAAAGSDLVISSGGVAVGKYDFVKDVVEELGHIDLWRVAMQPGKPVVLGAIGDTPFMGLPGNPVSIHVGFEQFVRPAIRKMRGCSSLLRPTMRASLTSDVEKRPGRLHFVRVRLEQGPEGWQAAPTGRQGSHIQSSLIDSHGVARFPAEKTRMEAGETVTVEVWKLPDGEGAT
jgi:molybdopterin molybdotransferase